MALSQETTARRAQTTERSTPERPTPEPQSAFAGPVCPPKITLPEAEFDAFVQAVDADERPTEKLRAGAAWFKQNGF